MNTHIEAEIMEPARADFLDALGEAWDALVTAVGTDAAEDIARTELDVLVDGAL